MAIHKLLERLQAGLRADTEQGSLFRSAAMMVLLKIAASAVAFLASLIYARALGPKDYGLYAYVLAWTSVMAIPASLGIPHYLLREGSRFHQSLGWLRRWADHRIWITGTIGGILLACGALIPSAAGARPLFLIAAPLPLIGNFASIRGALLQTRGYMARSFWPAMLLTPVLSLSILACLWLIYGRLDAIELVSVTLLTSIAPIIINSVQLRRFDEPVSAVPLPSVRVRAALPFMWLGSLYFLMSRTDLIVLGTLKGAHEAGIYAIATRMAELITFVMIAANTVIAPRIAKLYIDGQRTQLQNMLLKTSRRILLISTPVAVLLFAGATLWLRYLFGDEYSQGAPVLQILACAQFVIVLGGPLGETLDMTGNEKSNVATMGYAVAINVILNLALVPFFGAKGAAFATFTSILFARSTLWYIVRRRTGLRVSSLGI